MEILKVEHLVKKYGKGDSEVTAVMMCRLVLIRENLWR